MCEMALTPFDLRKMRIKEHVMALPEQRLLYAAALMDNDTLLITGGYGVQDPVTKRGTPIDTAILVDPRRGHLQKIAMVAPRGAHTLTKLADGTYLLVGGIGTDPKGGEIFDLRTKTFAPIEGKMKMGRKDHRAVLATDGKVYIVGGTMGSDAPTEIEVYDPTTKRFESTGLHLSQGREDPPLLMFQSLMSSLWPEESKKTLQVSPNRKTSM